MSDRETLIADARKMLRELTYVTPARSFKMIDSLAGALAAPVQVDEANLAEVLLDHAMDFEQRPRPAGPQGSGYVCECGLEILEPRTGPGIGWWHRKHLANAVAEWLRGGRQ